MENTTVKNDEHNGWYGEERWNYSISVIQVQEWRECTEREVLEALSWMLQNVISED